ncbi:MAG: efflux RND transporter periplasmic adaptor subunit [Campylobacterales bacterium]
MKKSILVTLFISSLLAGELIGATYRLAKTTQGSAVEEREIAATVYAPQETMVATRLMGYIKTIAVEEGDRVRKGQLLFEVDPSDITAMTNQAKTGVMMAENSYLDAQRDYERFKMLFERGAVTQRDLEKMELNLKMRKDALAIAKEQLAQAEAQMKYARVYAPISGVVVRKMGNPGSMAAPGMPIIVLSSTEKLRVQAMVKESDVAALKIGDSVTIEIPSLGKNTQGRIQAIVPAADMATRSVLVKFSISGVSGLMPGMYAKVKINGAKNSGIMVPLAALTTRGGIRGVFVADGGKARFVPLKVKQYLPDAVVADGIVAGLSVVLYPTENLVDGAVLK